MEENKGTKKESNKEIKSESEQISTPRSKKSVNPWMITSIVLAIGVIVLLVLVIKGGTNGGALSPNDAGAKLTQYLNTKTNGGVEFISATKNNPYYYDVNVKYKNQTIPVQVTPDGKTFIQGAVVMDGSDNTNAQAASDQQAQQPPAQVTKSAKPKVEAFVFAYCPYGLQFEKALFPAYDLLKDKADINIVYIGAMHGEFEHVESLRQIAILNLYGKDKLFSYLKEFNVNNNIGSCSGDAACLDKYLPAIYTKLGIDKSKIESFMNSSSEKIYQDNQARANSLGIGGSPTFVINGAEAQTDRTPEAIKEAICNAFTTTPAECSQKLSTASPDPGFGASSGSASSSAAGCGA